MAKDLTKDQQELMEENVQASPINRAPAQPPELGPDNDFGTVSDPGTGPDHGAPPEEDYSEEIAKAERLGFSTEDARKLAETGLLDSVLSRMPQLPPWMQQQAPVSQVPGQPLPYNPWAQPQGMPGQAPYGQPDPYAQQYGAQQYMPGPQPSQQAQDSMADFKIEEDFSNLPQVLGQMHKSHTSQVQEMQALIGHLYGQLQQQQAQQYTAWVNDRFTGLAGDGYEDVFGQGQIYPHSPQALNRQQVIKATEYYLSQNPNAAYDPVAKDQAFELAVKSLFGNRKQSNRQASARPTPIHRPRATRNGVVSDAFVRVAEKFRQYERENDGGG